jgi:hypothetical protein
MSWDAMTKIRRLGVAVLALAASTLTVPVAVYSQRSVWRLDLSRPITYFIAEGSTESGFREGDRTLAEWALQAWAGQADPPVDLAPGPEASATIRISWVAPGAGQYGEMRGRLVEGRPAADLFVHPDTDSLGLEIAARARRDPLFRDTVVYLTCVHELGHAFGLPHTSAFADIMYSFQHGGDLVAYFMRFRRKLEVRDDIRQASPFSAADGGAFKVLYH